MSFIARNALKAKTAKPAQFCSILRSYSQQPPTNDPDSTSAYEYKLQHSPRSPPPLPAQEPPRRWSAEESVKNILYNTPPPSTQPFKRHILNALVQNEPGVLSRVSGILAARGFNIDSLVVCRTEVRDLSRMCICIRGQDAVVEQARRQLEDLVPVWAVLDYTNTSVIERELLLVKVSLLGPEYFNEHFKPSASDPSFSLESARTYDEALTQFSQNQRHSQVQEDLTKMSLSEALRTKHAHLSALKNLADQFCGRLVDVSSDSVIVEVTGMMVMPRTPLPASWAEESDVAAEADEIDTSLLPPDHQSRVFKPSKSSSNANTNNKPYLPHLFTGTTNNPDDEHALNADDYDWAMFISAYAAGRWDPFEIPRPPLKSASSLSVDSRRTYSAHRALDKIDRLSTTRRRSSINEADIPTTPSNLLDSHSPSHAAPKSGQITHSAPMSQANSNAENANDHANGLDAPIYPLNLTSPRQNSAYGADLAVQVATHSLVQHSDEKAKNQFKGIHKEDERPSSAPNGTQKPPLSSQDTSQGYFDYVSPKNQEQPAPIAPIKAPERHYSFESSVSTDTSTPTNTRPQLLNREDSDRTVMNDAGLSQNPDFDIDRLTQAFDNQAIGSTSPSAASAKALPVEMSSIKDSIPSRLSSDRIQQLAEQQFDELTYLVPPLPLNEDARRKELFKFDLLRGTPDLSLDRILHLVKLVFQTKCVVISLVNGDTVLLKAHTGYEEMFETDVRTQEPRNTAMSSHAILQQNDEPLVSLDLTKDWRFSKNPSFSPKAKFYAAAPIRTYNGYNIGALALIDSQPRTEFTPRQRHTLKEFAAIVLREMELWRDKCQMRTRDLIQSSMEQFNRDILEMNSAGNAKSRNVSDMQKVYDKAAKLIKDTLGVEGALVLDISQFEVAENLGDDNELYMPVCVLSALRLFTNNIQDPVTKSSQRETPSRTTSSTNINMMDRRSKSHTQRPPLNKTNTSDTYARSIPILAASEDGPKPLTRFHPVSEENAEKLAWFLKRNPDGYIFDYGLIPGVFRQFVGVKEKYGMAIVPIFNLSNDKDGPFALLVAYTGDRKLLLEGYEIQFLRAMGVIILSAVLKERILLADKAKQNFISNISHELRTPLHGILAAAELLQDTELDEVQVEFLDTVKACGRSLSETLNHVLDFTKLSGSNTSAGVERGIRLSKVNLKSLVEEAVESTIIGYRGKFAASNEGLGDIYAPPSSSSSSPSLTSQKVDQITKAIPVEILVDVQFRSNWFCKCEKAGLRRVLQNLVGNSQKFTKHGYIMIVLREAPHSPGAKKIPIELSVIDTGKGMSKSFLDSQVFQPFSQEDPLQAGTGLGLAIVSSIIKSPSVNGQVDIRSREDFGTEIKLTIPIEIIDDGSGAEKTTDQANIVEKLGYSPNWKLKVSMHGFDTSSIGGQALYNVTSNYLQNWLGLECLNSTAQNNYHGDILVLNESRDKLVSLIDKRDARKPIVLISSSRADKQLYGAKVEYERMGGIARIIYKPAGPTKFDSVMVTLIDSLAQRTGQQRSEKKQGSNVDYTGRNLPMPSPAESSGSSRSDYFGDGSGDHSNDSPKGGNDSLEKWKDNVPEFVSPSSQRKPSTDSMMSVQRRNSDKSTNSSATLPTRPGMAPRSVTFHNTTGSVHNNSSSNVNQLNQNKSVSGNWSAFASSSKDTQSSSPSTPGSTISISGAGAILKTSTEDEPVKTHGEPFRVLCVDDNAVNLNLLTKFLKKKGCEYVEATDGKQAVDIMEANSPGYFSVILMDVSMPVMDGLQATIEIRKIEQQRRKEMRESRDKSLQKSYLTAKEGEVTPPAKIFALTGLAAKEDRRRAFGAGVDGYLIKPASFKSLELLLSRIGVSKKAPAPTPPTT
ncbi:hypothetical protein E3P98_01021 [Wallemia ichthyophaga]|nr:hypothetical protein E3P98_01021 [Wallemia ichthyophaga]